MKKICMLLALLMLALCIPALAESGMDEAWLCGDWVHEGSDEVYLLFDGSSRFYYEDGETFYYGVYRYIGEDTFLLIDDMGTERRVSINDDASISLSDALGDFTCRYRYLLMKFPNRDACSWLHDDGETLLDFDLYGNFELDTPDSYYYGRYDYQGGGDYLLRDVDGTEFTASLYVDDSVGIQGMSGYFWPHDLLAGEDPFELADSLIDGCEPAEEPETEEPAEEEPAFPGTPFDSDPLELSGTWYKFADTEKLPFILDGSDYACENYIFGSPSEGTWVLGEVVLFISGEESAPSAYIEMESYDGMSPGWDPIPMAGNRLLYANAWDVWFLHESVLGTEEGALLERLGEFLQTGWWWTGGTSTSLEFSAMGNAIVFASYNEEGEGSQEIIGRWRLEEGAVVAEFDDGSTARYPLPAQTVKARGLTFETR